VPFFRSVLDLVVNVLLEHVLVRELHMAVEILQPGRLAKTDELVVDEAILDAVELVNNLCNCLTLILYKVLDKSISDGNPKAIAVTNYKAVRVGGGGTVEDMCYERHGTREEPGTLTQVAPCFPWFLSFGNRTQNSRVAGARPNHQPIWGSDPNHQGIWSPPRCSCQLQKTRERAGD
jgi:hypothetical protein